jgi:hypothetical protein
MQAIPLDRRRRLVAAGGFFEELDQAVTVPAFGNLKDAAVKTIDGRGESGPRALTKRTPTLRWHLIASKRFANAHSECVTIPALGDVSSQIDVVLLA